MSLFDWSTVDIQQLVVESCRTVAGWLFWCHMSAVWISLISIWHPSRHLGFIQCEHNTTGFTPGFTMGFV